MLNNNISDKIFNNIYDVIYDNIGGGATVQGLQIIGSRSGAVTARRQGTASSRSDIRQDSRCKVFIGASGASEIKVAYTGVWQQAGVGETPLGNDYTAQAALETEAPQSVAYNDFLFSGNTTATVPNDGVLMSDTLSLSVTAGQKIYIRQGFTISSSSLFLPSCALPWASGGGDFQSVNPEVAGQVQSTGAMTNPGSGITSVAGTLPFAVLGKTSSPQVSIGILGDSIADGQGDQLSASTSGALGYIERGLDGVAGFTLPWVNWAVSSNRLQFDTSVTGAKKRDFFPYITHLIVALGTNDIGNGRSLAQMQADLTDIANNAKSINNPYGDRLKVGACVVSPRTTSTDSWATTANQTPVSGWESGGLRDQWNAWLLTQVGTLLDFVIDTRVSTDDPTEPEKWAVNGVANYATNDGLHQRGAMHALMKVQVNDMVVTFTV